MRNLTLTIVACLAPLAVGCAVSMDQPVTGIIYQGAMGSKAATSTAVGAKTGEACSSSVLGLVGFGDGSVKAAAGAGQITQISTVDTKNFGILGIYAKNCTVVTGN